MRVLPGSTRPTARHRSGVRSGQLGRAPGTALSANGRPWDARCPRPELTVDVDSAAGNLDVAQQPVVPVRVGLSGIRDQDHLGAAGRTAIVMTCFTAGGP